VIRATRQRLRELARCAALAVPGARVGRSYRFAAVATPDVVLALVQAVDAIQGLCETDAPSSRVRRFSGPWTRPWLTWPFGPEPPFPAFPGGFRPGWAGRSGIGPNKRHPWGMAGQSVL
jgi:hypothetical protein